MTLKTYNPATEELLAELPMTPSEALPAMIEKAKAAGAQWAQLDFEARGALLIEAYQGLLDGAEAMADLIHREMGKTQREALGEAKGFPGGIRSLVKEMGEALAPTTHDDGHVKTTTYHDPFGVCACIAPWNFPLGMPHSLVAPALLAGNAAILKPSEEVPLVALEYVKILNRVLPEGLLQIVIGDDEIGRALVQSDVQLITFTGSQSAGKHILSEAGKGLKRVILELGGKDPLLVLADADLRAAAKFATQNSFRNAGQVCVSTEKILIPKSVESEFLALMKDYAQDFEVGAMINNRQKSHVLEQVNHALAQGATLVHGDASPTAGNRLEPMILKDVQPDMSIMVDETFGPVACVYTYEDVETAIEVANRGDFGLGAALFATDMDAARAVARRLTAGMIGINKGCGGASGSPWVGAKGSGYGFHGSIEGHRQFTQTRIISEIL